MRVGPGVVRLTAALCLTMCAPLLAHGEPYEQIERISREIERDPNDAELYLARGGLHRISGHLEAALADSVEEIIGEVVAFCLHDNVTLSGSNATYTITTMRFERVMDIRLTGPPKKRGLFIQPVS